MMYFMQNKSNNFFDTAPRRAPRKNFFLTKPPGGVEEIITTKQD
jgi:hypothetical protein